MSTWTRRSLPSPTPTLRLQPSVEEAGEPEVDVEVDSIVAAAEINVAEEVPDSRAVKPVEVEVKVAEVTVVLAIQMGLQIKPAGCTGNLGSLRTSVWIRLSVPGRIFLLQNLNQTNEK